MSNRLVSRWLLILCLLISNQLQALSTVNISILKTAGMGFQADNTLLQLTGLEQDKARVQLDIAQVSSQSLQGEKLNSLQINCSSVLLSVDQVSCETGTINVRNRFVQAKNSRVVLNYWPQATRADIQVDDLILLSGKLSGKFQLTPESQSVALSLEQVAVNQEKLASLPQFPSHTLSFSGLLSGDIGVENNNGKIQADYDISVNQLAFSDEPGENLAEGLSLSIRGGYLLDNKQHSLKKIAARLSSGEILTPFFYSNFNQRPASLRVRQINYHQQQQWNLDNLVFDDAFIKVSATKMTGQNIKVSHGSLQLAPVNLEKVYAYYFLPVYSNELAQLSLQGRLKADLEIRDNKLASYEIDLTGVNLQHQPTVGESKFALNNLQAALVNNRIGKADSFVSWDSAHLLETIDFGQTRLGLTTTGHSIGLAAGSVLPVFDGQLLIDKSELDFSQPAVAVQFQGVLTPVSLKHVTHALNWPEMKGKISGVIPAVSYQDGNAKIDGKLLIKVFEGDILINDVKASHLLSAWPVLQADFEFRNIDLEQMTQTFEFGRITGLLDGSINNLLLENWRPTKFDAKFQTAEESSHKRISQKAVDNITNLGGGGMSGALSRSFMRFFDDFGYDKIGFSCKLRDGICEMEGVADANRGYYLVKGGGIPRIDVIGHNRQTDWNILIDRLANISQSGTPTIQ